MAKSKEIQVHEALQSHDWFYLEVGVRNPWNRTIETLVFGSDIEGTTDIRFRMCPVCNRVEMKSLEEWKVRVPEDDTIRHLFLEASKEFQKNILV